MSNKFKYICYPFIHDNDWRTDYEVLTDGLSSEIGFAASLNKDNKNIYNDLVKLTAIVLDLNPLTRKPDKKIEEEMKRSIENMYDKYNIKFENFYLPIGPKEATSISRLRLITKQVIRLVAKNDKSNQNILDCFNLLTNLFHLMYLSLNNDLVVFKSKSY